MRRLVAAALSLGLIGLALFWLLTRPNPLPEDTLAGLTGDAARGEAVFWAAGCASCHMAPGAIGEAKLVLAGGQKFPSPFGTFTAPNISPDPEHGIGGWTPMMLANAMLRGVSPEGAHYYPVFPYPSYIRMELADAADLHAYLMTLPASATPDAPHDVGFPFSIRRLLGGWKLFFLGNGWAVGGGLTEAEARGRYLVEALGHCGECHTPRNFLGGPQRRRWLAGGPIPAAKGNFPNITPAKLDWSEADIAEYLNSGFTPDFDTAGGHMALVVENTARLAGSDRAAIAAYLKRVPASE